MNGMNKATRIGLPVALGCVFVLTGCNTRPDMPRSHWHKKPVKVLTVNASDPAEVQAATAVEAARSRYQQALVSLVDFYQRIGDVTKGRWAQQEMDNLAQAQDFTFSGITPPPVPAGAPAGETKEYLLVENVTGAREEYLDALDSLAQYYEKNNDEFKAAMIHTAQSRFFNEETFLYLHKAELPPADLEPRKIVPQANELFDQAVALYDQAAGSFPSVDYAKQRQALGMFLRLIRRHPESTRIALAAFYIGNIYADYFNEPLLAAKWYERAWTWDPFLPQPARFRCAVVYDEKLNDKAKAIECYQACLVHEPFWKANGKVARKRIEELGVELEYQSPLPGPETTPPPSSQPAP